MMLTEKTYQIEYQMLTYNMPPPCDHFVYLDHLFETQKAPSNIEDVVVNDRYPLIYNMQFICCVSKLANGSNVYVTAKNNERIIYTIKSGKIDDEENLRLIQSIVDERVGIIQKCIIFQTNLHIFFPSIFIVIYDECGRAVSKYNSSYNCPVEYQRWSAKREGIEVEKRLGTHINIQEHRRVIENCPKYARAFKYYIDSFYISNTSCAFSLLCSALDAVTGSRNHTNETSKRMAKYVSILFCQPLEVCENEEVIRKMYDMRSDYVHGRGQEISVNDEIALREYVRKFLIAFYLFFCNLKIKAESQIYQKLNNIYDDHSLYTKLVPFAYSAVSLINEHEKKGSNIFTLDTKDKLALLISKQLEAMC